MAGRPGGASSRAPVVMKRNAALALTGVLDLARHRPIGPYLDLLRQQDKIIPRKRSWPAIDWLFQLRPLSLDPVLHVAPGGQSIRRSVND